MTATLERLHSSFLVSFESDLVNLVFSTLRNGKEALSAEVEVLTTNPGFGPVLLGPKQLNILSERTQAQWAGTLRDRCPVVSDWHGLLTEACRLVLRSYRAGEPSVRMGDIPRPEAGSWLLPGLILARMPAMIFGDGSAGKTLIALAMAESVQRYEEILPGIKPAQQANVLWLDWEFDGWENAQRSRAMTGLDSDIRYRRMSGALADQIESIEREVDRYGIGLIVNDSAAFACGGKPEDSEQTNRYFDACRRLDRGLLGIAHETKDNSRFGSHDKPFGSVFWHNSSRATWFVQKQQDEQGKDEQLVSLHVGLFNKKTNQGRLWQPYGFRADIRNDERGEMTSVRFAREDVRDIEGLRASTPLREQIKRWLEHGPATAAILSVELDQKADSIRRTLIRMEHARQVVVLEASGDKLYGLAHNNIDLSNLEF